MTSKLIQPRKSGGDIDKLNPQQRMFVEYLLADESFNATAAAKKAGYKVPQQRAWKLLKTQRIKAIIGKALGERITRCQLTADAVLEHLRTALFLDPLDLFEKTGKNTYLIRNLEDVPEDVRRCITKLKCKTTTVGKKTDVYIEIELMSKDSALVNAMKHLMLLDPDQSQVNVNVNGVDLKSLLQRVEENRNVIDGKVIDRIAKME